MADLIYPTFTFSPPPPAWHKAYGNGITKDRAVRCYVLSFCMEMDGMYHVHDAESGSVYRISSKDLYWKDRDALERGLEIGPSRG